MILEGEIKDAKMSSISPDFQTLIKPFLWVLMNLRKYNNAILNFHNAQKDIVKLSKAFTFTKANQWIRSAHEYSFFNRLIMSSVFFFFNSL